MIIYINKKKYDITEFIKEHPGGADVFKDGQDMTEAFNDVGHSKEAIKMLETYLVHEETGEEEAGEEKEEQRDVDLNAISIQEFLLFKFKQTKFSRLFTKEDKANVHKILGSIALIFYLCFFSDLYYSGFKGQLSILKHNRLFMVVLLILLVLSLSSLQFNIPKNLNMTKPSLNQEFRGVNILFVVRSFLIIFILYLTEAKSLLVQMVISVIILLNMYFVDAYGKRIRDNDHINSSTIRHAIPFWKECPNTVKNYIKQMYSGAQLTFTSWCFEPDINIQICAIFILQLASFGATLSKKNILSVMGWHIMYIGTYILVFLGFIRSKNILKRILIGLVCFYLRTKLSINKYTLWSVYGLIIMFIKHTKKNPISIIKYLVLMVTLLTVMNSKNMIFDKKRPDANNRVVNHRTHHNHHRITVKMANDFDFHPGQYFNLFVTTEKRSYTPIFVDGTIMEFLIKNYENGALSPKICKHYCKHSDVNVLGPFGKNYYVPDKDALMINGSEIQTQNILMFCCGTGITPFYSILTNLSSNTKYQMKLFCSFKSKKDTFLVDKLPNKPKLFLSNKDHRLNPKRIGKILKRYNPEETSVLVCGTEGYQNMVESAVKEYSDKIQTIKW